MIQQVFTDYSNDFASRLFPTMQHIDGKITISSMGKFEIRKHLSTLPLAMVQQNAEAIPPISWQTTK
jgi:hypothetical protein